MLKYTQDTSSSGNRAGAAHVFNKSSLLWNYIDQPRKCNSMVLVRYLIVLSLSVLALSLNIERKKGNAQSQPIQQ